MVGPGKNDVPWASQKSRVDDESSSTIINTAWPPFLASQCFELLTNDMNMVEVSGSTPWVSTFYVRLTTCTV